MGNGFVGGAGGAFGAAIMFLLFIRFFITIYPFYRKDIPNETESSDSSSKCYDVSTKLGFLYLDPYVEEEIWISERDKSRVSEISKEDDYHVLVNKEKDELPSNINARLLKKRKDLDSYTGNSKCRENSKSRAQLWLAENLILRSQEARKRLEKYLKRLHENGIFHDCLVVLIICFFVFILVYWAIFGGDCRHHGPFLACGEQ